MADLPRQGDIEIRIVEPTKQIPVNTITDGSIERLAVEIAGTSDSIINPRPGKAFNQFLENAGSKDLNVDGSGTPVIFTAAPPTGKKWYIYMVSLIMEDQNINYSKFGGLSSLTNGLDLKVKEGGEAEITIGNFKQNGDFYLLANQIVLQSASTDILQMHFTVRTNTGTSYQLSDSLTETFSAVVNDNLTVINRFNILIQGYEVNE